MARLKSITEADLDDAQRAVFDAIQGGPRGNMGLIGPFAVYVRAPGVGNAAQALGAAVRFGTALPENVKEVAICTVGAHFHSKFEFAAHTELAKKAGVAASIIESLRIGELPAIRDESERIAHEVAAQLLVNHRLSDELYAKAVRVLGETQLIELVATVGYYSLVSLTLNAFEVPLREGMTDPFATLPG